MLVCASSSASLKSVQRDEFGVLALLGPWIRFCACLLAVSVFLFNCWNWATWSGVAWSAIARLKSVISLVLGVGLDAPVEGRPALCPPRWASSVEGHIRRTI